MYEKMPLQGEEKLGTETECAVAHNGCIITRSKTLGRIAVWLHGWNFGIDTHDSQPGFKPISPSEILSNELRHFWVSAWTIALTLLGSRLGLSELLQACLSSFRSPI
jgi:hypothetical protein